MVTENNKMAKIPMKRLFWSMGIPMIVSMVLQALYNVVDSIFVANMSGTGAIANQALTLAFPVQILIIALGVGTGVGLNALLSKSLGEKNFEKVNKTAGNGIFLALVIYVFFLFFGLFGSRWFITLFAGGNSDVIEMGTDYLTIVTTLSLGSICFVVYERFLQSTGKTMHSTIAQISGALTNIILDYIFIYPFNMGVAGAAWATVIGQFISLFIAMFFHYRFNHEIDGNVKYIRPDGSIIKAIYSIGISAAVMQALLSVMMAGMNAILNTANADPAVLVGSFGIYYKIQQIALFAAFGLSNTMISILSFNFGMKDKNRSKDCVKYGILDTLIVTLIISIVFEILAEPLASLFGMAGGTSTEMIDVCARAIRIASLGYVFMGFSVAVQGVLQALRYAIRPLVISMCRLVIFVFPVAWLFTQSENVMYIVWWTFPIAEILTCIISVFILLKSYKEKIAALEERTAVPEMNASSESVVIAISRQHGTNGKHIARALARELGISFYDKEEIKNYAIAQKLVEDKDDNELYQEFLSLDVEKDSIIKQAEAIRSIIRKNSCVFVGRGADFAAENHPNLIRIYLYAPMEYRVQNIMRNYGDSENQARKHIEKSDATRARYYELITNRTWGDKDNYDLCINCELGEEKVIHIVKEYVNGFFML